MKPEDYIDENYVPTEDGKYRRDREFYPEALDCRKRWISESVQKIQARQNRDNSQVRLKAKGNWRETNRLFYNRS